MAFPNCVIGQADLAMAVPTSAVTKTDGGFFSLICAASIWAGVRRVFSWLAPVLVVVKDRG